MNPILKNILAVIAGVLVGGLVNMALIMMSSHIIPPPEGVDVTTMEGLKAGLHLFEPRHFIFPFLAHALGMLVGAIIVVLIAANNHMRFAMGIGVWFLLGGIMNIFMLPSPLWFTIVDLVGAYLPMAWLGARIVLRNKTTND